MEELNKSQIVLLTLLVSFVTSIATGIVTVSLMEQAPPVIAQTVNRVIERTIETVAPTSQAAASAVTRERTVVVRETELISQAVAKVSPSIVRLYTSSSTSATFLGLGIVLSADGMIVTDAEALGSADSVSMALSDGTRMQALVTENDKAAGLVFLQATSTGTIIALKPATIAVATPVLGQTVVALSGKSVDRIEDGIVTALIPSEADPPGGPVIDTNISPDSTVSGSPLVNTEGEIVGVSTLISRASSLKGFITSSVLVKKPALAEKPEEKPAAE